MNFPSNPNPSFTELDFHLDFYSVSDILLMMEDDESNREGSPSSTWSANSSEKVTPDGTSPPTSVATSFVSHDIGEREERKKRRQGNAPIHVFRTKSIDEDMLDDGYKWRKYGKKPIRGSPYPRHYHRCSNPNCVVKKKIERDIGDPDYVLTTYEGKHNHGSPSVVYCEPDEIEFMSRNGWCFQNNSNLSRSAP
ncbi:PREDICTED: probable WRKY transcription factor 59 [Tarenaya hassleriana]|uniref:probable WRKY transcription factor 59 n=1 Tax=Tarenaya hassleriana TaxID=28532 RepID=UPI00053C17DE|nr:PREDICTED: probable WRKY transcription factor 59 [Tarenaya hassleriana]